MSTLGIRAALSIGLIVALLSVSCEDTTEVSGPNSVRLDEWRIELGSSEVASGAMKLQAQNVGTMTHDLFVIRTDLAPDKLPVASGIVDLKQLDVISKKEDIGRREKTSLDVNLTSGTYVFICNISGHYALGMRAGLSVK